MRITENELGRTVSAERIREALRSITLTEFSLDEKEYYLKNNKDKVGKELFRVLKVKEPDNITVKEDFKI